ncbi:MAG: ATP-dependent helicase HrpB, partial [Proteobacteria bacterium]
ARDILVFLPGTGEIDRTHQNIQTWAEENAIDIVPLHGSLQLEAQQKALRAGPRRRIILSTNIAESSVTVDGVACVIDTGLAKNMKFDLRTGFSRLELGRISKASAQQRAGRSARQYPGVCYRLWNKLDESSMPAHEIPEILRSELSDSLLFLAAQGVRDFESFSWFEKPAKLSLQKAVENLLSIGAIDTANNITPVGKTLLTWPLPPRLAKLMLSSIEMKVPQLGADVAAILQERDFVTRQGSEGAIGDQLESDILFRLDLLNQFRDGPSPRNAHRLGLQTVDRSAQQILSYVKDAVSIKVKDLSVSLQQLLLSSFADRLCRRRVPGAERALMIGGRGVKLAADSLVRESEFFFALDGIENSKNSETTVAMASGIDKDVLLGALQSRIEKRKELKFDREKAQFYLRETKVFGEVKPAG